MKKLLTSTIQAENHPGLWLLWGIVLLFLGNASIPLWDQDEAAYAGFAHQMVESGDWLSQEFTWSDIHRKPPWHVWTIAGSYSILGENEFATRLPSALAILLLGLMLWRMNRKNTGLPVSALSVVILSFSFFVPLLGKIALTDGWLLLWDTLALLALWQVLEDKGKGSVWLFWLAIAMGLLTKGPAIILVVGTACGMIVFFHPQRRRIWRLQPWFGLPLALLPLLGWGYFAWQQDGGEMIRWMIDWYILKRTGGTVLGQSGPPGYFLLTLLLAFFPFLRQLPVAMTGWWKRVRLKETEALLLLAWMMGSWWIWELIPSKLPAYAIGVHPVIAILLAREYQDPSFAQPIWYKIGNVLQGLISSILAIGLIGGAIYLLPASGIVMAIFAALVVLASWLIPYFRRDHQLHYYQLFLIGLFWLLALGGIMPQVSQLRDTPRELAANLSQELAPETTIVLSNRRGNPPSLPFYLSQHFANVKESYDLAQMIAFYQGPEAHVLILTEAQFNDMKSPIPDLQAEIYPVFSSDRIRGNAYYVLVNPGQKP